MLLFLMYRVELKALHKSWIDFRISKFLMYRVELKDKMDYVKLLFLAIVPNVPCGVESSILFNCLTNSLAVPNVPCGVESILSLNLFKTSSKFLMYRVELKVCGYEEVFLLQFCVPNVPCGVERSHMLIMKG